MNKTKFCCLIRDIKFQSVSIYQPVFQWLKSYQNWIHYQPLLLQIQIKLIIIIFINRSNLKHNPFFYFSMAAMKNFFKIMILSLKILSKLHVNSSCQVLLQFRIDVFRWCIPKKFLLIVEFVDISFLIAKSSYLSRNNINKHYDE